MKFILFLMKKKINEVIEVKVVKEGKARRKIISYLKLENYLKGSISGNKHDISEEHNRPPQTRLENIQDKNTASLNDTFVVVSSLSRSARTPAGPASCPSSTAATKTKNPNRNGQESKNLAGRTTARRTEGRRMKERVLRRSRVGRLTMLDA